VINYNNIAFMYLIHELGIAQHSTICHYCGWIITHMKSQVQGFKHAKAETLASIGEKVRQCLTS
jgi:hypothetical protein